MKVPSFLSSSSTAWLAALLLALSPGAFAAQEKPPVVPDTPASPAPSARPTDPAAVEAPSAEVAKNEAPADEDRPKRRHRRRGRGDVRFGSTVSVPAGDRHEQDIVVMGGAVDVAGSQKGDVVLFGGGAKISGDVDGDVVVMGGSLHLASSAKVDGDVVVMGGALQKEDGASITGETVEMGTPGMAAGVLPAFSAIPWDWNFGIGLGFLSILGWLKTVVLTLLLTLVIAAVLPARVEAAAVTMREQWLACLGWGVVAFLLSFPLTLLLCLTCVGVVIPYLFYQIAKYFGLAVLFAVVGHALARNSLHREVSLIPALLLGFLVLSLIGLLAPVWIVYGWFAVGCALLTKFGAMRPWYGPRTPPREDPDLPPPAPLAPPTGEVL
jgi:hypothetical protein